MRKYFRACTNRVCIITGVESCIYLNSIWIIFRAHLTLSHGTLARFGTVLEKHWFIPFRPLGKFRVHSPNCLFVRNWKETIVAFLFFFFKLKLYFIISPPHRTSLHLKKEKKIMTLKTIIKKCWVTVHLENLLEAEVLLAAAAAGSHRWLSVTPCLCVHSSKVRFLTLMSFEGSVCRRCSTEAELAQQHTHLTLAPPWNTRKRNWSLPLGIK